MAKGIIKEIYREKGYGYIYQDDEKIYFKIEDIIDKNKNEIQEGKRVSFQKGTELTEDLELLR